MSNMGQRIAARRKELGMTQNDFAQKLGISFQAVSNWERGETMPEIERIKDIAVLLQTSASYLLEETDISTNTESLAEKLYDEEHMFTYIKSFANSGGFSQTYKALIFARKKHEGQYRKGAHEKIPYITHPLNITCHALALGLHDDDLLSAALLHDVCEDCGVRPEELPAGVIVQEAVSLLSFSQNEGESYHDAKARYYSLMAGNRIAVMVKLLDRCHNVSCMAFGFSRDKMRRYIEETREFVLPMLEMARNEYPEYNNALYLLKYQICSVINSIERLI